MTLLLYQAREPAGEIGGLIHAPEKIMFQCFTGAQSLKGTEVRNV